MPKPTKTADMQDSNQLNQEGRKTSEATLATRLSNVDNSPVKKNWLLQSLVFTSNFFKAIAIGVYNSFAVLAVWLYIILCVLMSVGSFTQGHPLVALAYFSLCILMLPKVRFEIALMTRLRPWVLAFLNIFCFLLLSYAIEAGYINMQV